MDDKLNWTATQWYHYALELEEKLKQAQDVIEFYANNITSVWDCTGENLLEDCSVTARNYIEGKKLSKKVYKLTALEICGYGEDDRTIGLYSSEKIASDAFERWRADQDFPDEYAKHIVEYNLDDLGD